MDEPKATEQDSENSVSNSITCSPGPAPAAVTAAMQTVLDINSTEMITAYTDFIIEGATLLDAARSARIDLITHDVNIEDGIVFETLASCQDFQGRIYPYTLTPPEGGVTALNRLACRSSPAWTVAAKRGSP